VLLITPLEMNVHHENIWCKCGSRPLVCYVMVIVLAIGPKVRGFKSGPQQWIFKGDKNWLLRRGRNVVGPMLRDFMAC
jgi:hypothetical protein